MKLEVKLTHSPRICVVDKSKSYRQIIERMIKALGYQNVHSFASSSDLLELDFNPDILILDYDAGPSNMNGLEFMSKYGNTLLYQTKFIFLSSNTNLEIAVSAIRMGAFDYIVKSKIGLDRLVKRLEKLVNIYQNNYRRTVFLKRAVISLGMLSAIFFLAIFLYSH